VRPLTPPSPPGGLCRRDEERVRGQFTNPKEVNRFLIGQFWHMGKFFFRTQLKVKDASCPKVFKSGFRMALNTYLL